MTSMWNYRDDVTLSDAGLTGYDVEASDGSIGKIDESSADAGSGYVVVDTGFWIFGKKRLIPASVIERVDADEGKVYVGMTKDQIKDAPDYEESHRTSRDDEDYNYYEPYGYADRPTDYP